MGLRAILLLALLVETLAADESCMDRCENGFDAQRSCQCDSMCKYYKSCCSDFEAICGMTTRGDTFVFAEDEDDDDELFESTTPFPPRSAPFLTPTDHQVKPTLDPVSDFGHRAIPFPTRSPETDTIPETTTVPVTAATTAAPDPDAEVCSGRPFDSYMQLKNGSMYAFRGKYFFELGQRSVIPGYPKLIKDVWGIDGPIDAAFTRVNCQGKTYIFKGTKYWRFDDGMLDGDYPRDINVGFEKIPDHVDAAFALPAPGHHGKERVYFFKGDQYYIYEFLHQPSHEECIRMSEGTPPTLFRRYTDIYHNNYEHFFSELFSDLPQHHDKHHFINRDWKGLRSPVDAAMAGRIYVPPWRVLPRHNGYVPDERWGQQYGQQYGQQWGRRRQSRSPFWGSIAERGMNMGQGLRFGRDWERRWDRDWDRDWRRDRYRQNNRGNYDSRNGRSYWERQRGVPIQSVYFFKGDQYYRVNLSTKSVDPAVPPYPRSIARYWLGCTDTARAEKK
uniref:Vitronectin a n=1 Tax=Echeneis naucrates TaxID=173247 RepID=A0A665UT62_ECHNA